MTRLTANYCCSLIHHRQSALRQAPVAERPIALGAAWWNRFAGPRWSSCITASEKWRKPMKTRVVVLSALLGMSMSAAQAGPCTTEIDNLTKTMASKDAGQGPTPGAGTSTLGSTSAGTSADRGHEQADTGCSDILAGRTSAERGAAHRRAERGQGDATTSAHCGDKSAYAGPSRSIRRPTAYGCNERKNPGSNARAGCRNEHSGRQRCIDVRAPSRRSGQGSGLHQRDRRGETALWSALEHFPAKCAAVRRRKCDRCKEFRA